MSRDDVLINHINVFAVHLWIDRMSISVNIKCCLYTTWLWVVLYMCAMNAGKEDVTWEIRDKQWNNFLGIKWPRKYLSSYKYAKAFNNYNLFVIIRNYQNFHKLEMFHSVLAMFILTISNSNPKATQKFGLVP